jgi:hypothetical protein
MSLRFLVLPLALVACGKDAPSGAAPAPSAAATPQASAAAPAPTPTPAPTPAAGDAPADTKVDSLPLVGPDAPEFKAVDAPAAKDVPAGPVTGSANGERFEPKVILFEPEKKGWKLIVSDKPMGKPTDMLMPGSQTINASLNTATISAGQKIAKAMKAGDGFFQIVTPETPTKTTSLNTANAYYIEFTKWDVKPYDPKAGFMQQAGTASGKLYIVHKPNDPLKKKGYKDSGVAGTFTDAVVRYKGEPKFQ